MRSNGCVFVFHTLQCDWLWCVDDLQKLAEEEQKKKWEEEKKARSYEGMFDEERFQEKQDWSDDDFM